MQFAIGHQQIATFRASFADIDALLSVGDRAITLEGEARVESVSIAEPPEFRDHVVRGTDFFDADAYPSIGFRSTRFEFEVDGTATVTGELTIRGTTRRTYHPAREDPFGNYRAGLELLATVDRRSWGLNWQLPLPDGSDALGWDVEITAQLELIKKD